MTVTDQTPPPGAAAPAAGVAARPGPVRPQDRIAALDVLRGLAILGILAVNALPFAWPFEMLMTREAAPYAPGGLMGPGDAAATWVVEVFFQDKMRTLFALLFGVSIFLVGGEREDDDRGRLLRRRLFWLAVIGLIHGLGLWFGDILLLYAWSGLFMLLFRSWPARRLLWVGAGITLAFAVLQAGGALFMANAPAEIAAQMNNNPFAGTTEDVLASVAVYRESWAGAWAANARAWLVATGFALVTMPFAVVPLMMIGLGLFKSGFLTGRSPTSVYVAVAGLGALSLAALGWGLALELGAPTAENPSGGLAGAAAAFAPLATLGYAALLILALTRGGEALARGLTRILAPVGRMAFTNYLAQTLIMTSLFYLPWGPRWFGQISPAGLWAVVIAVWLVQLVWSPLWLARFQMGPLEWLWRRLTYGRPVALRRPD